MAEVILGETEDVIVTLGGENSKNEIVIRGKESFADPVKIILVGPVGSPIKGTYSFATPRADGRYEEVVFLKGAQDERFRHDPLNRSGEFETFCRHDSPIYMRDDDQWHRTSRHRWDGIEYFREITFHAGVRNFQIPFVPVIQPAPVEPVKPIEPVVEVKNQLSNSQHILDFVKRAYNFDVDNGHAAEFLNGNMSLDELILRMYHRSL